MNVLVDAQHHAALYESLCLVFEDRFGWKVYSPVGMEWVDERVWRWSNAPIDYTMADFLTPYGELVGDHYELVEREFPERPRKQVTYEQARSMKWDFVLASVVPHQHSFAEFAKEVGARFIYQVGNAIQPIDWEIEDMLVMASANISLPDRSRGIIYHQEFSRELFHYEPPREHALVTSFMMRLHWSCDPGWLIFKQDVHFQAIGGHSPRSGTYLTPMSAVAELYRRTGWVWHDKQMGDGYGHALYNAVACGRPLIGHSQHYRGQLGQEMWVDGVTCLDLTDHTTDHVYQRWQQISQDPDKHRSLCQAAAEHFDRVVHFDEDAAAIWRLLGG